MSKNSTAISDPDQTLKLPTLCVIDENGHEIPQESFLDQNRSYKRRNATGNLSLFGQDNLLGQTHDTRFLTPDSPLNELKAVTDRLKLSARRKSTIDWQQENLTGKRTSTNSVRKGENTRFESEWKTKINDAFDWMYSELAEMQSQDASLARQFLVIRKEIHQLKLQKSCEKHREMLDDATIDLEESSELNEISDLPDFAVDTPLRQLGVMRMHLNSRRFSTC